MHPDVVSYNTTMKAAMAAGDVRAAATLHAEGRCRGMSVPGATYSQLLVAAAEYGEHDVVLYMWHAMLEEQTPPTPASASTYLRSLVTLVRISRCCNMPRDSVVLWTAA